ncbi:MAG TPA: MarR family transcriptional regulator [Bacteroidia bacterium]|jgi:DNA-binding transcriptional regulator GbsR (MarR family)|nr:MarR family transcriptional regulator [Bacteroidia bacterium]
MKYTEGKEKFIEAWGKLGSSWGINRTMAQIHALLLISPEPLSTEQIMEELNISRGNANMNTRALIDWGIVHKELKSGDRKEYFYAEKDIWYVATQVAKERKRRELEPVVKVLGQMKEVEDDKTKATAEFKKMTAELHGFSKKVDGMLDAFIKAEASWFFSKFFKLFK